ncbi:hypothetical protein DM02DRAFT_662996 [Periconia macrospinosa]|uniref:Uncharacterized protein n=1 Tax=Periconia macrospinosa TaxID=97972 RepID=A0A2V1D4G6_9PLEO|nr:hypothetical protein DM02DRAFT_662996 [Periconia macrospinosa]
MYHFEILVALAAIQFFSLIIFAIQTLLPLLFRRFEIHSHPILADDESLPAKQTFVHQKLRSFHPSLIAIVFLQEILLVLALKFQRREKLVNAGDVFVNANTAFGILAIWIIHNSSPVPYDPRACHLGIPECFVASVTFLSLVSLPVDYFVVNQDYSGTYLIFSTILIISCTIMIVVLRFEWSSSCTPWFLVLHMIVAAVGLIVSKCSKEGTAWGREYNAICLAAVQAFFLLCDLSIRIPCILKCTKRNLACSKLVWMLLERYEKRHSSVQQGLTSRVYMRLCAEERDALLDICMSEVDALEVLDSQGTDELQKLKVKITDLFYPPRHDAWWA